MKAPSGQVPRSSGPSPRYGFIPAHCIQPIQMAAAKKSVKKTKGRREFQSWFRKELKKSVKEDKEILEALD